MPHFTTPPTNIIRSFGERLMKGAEAFSLKLTLSSPQRSNAQVGRIVFKFGRLSSKKYDYFFLPEPFLFDPFLLPFSLVGASASGVGLPLFICPRV